jgi:hypothetical protein
MGASVNRVFQTPGALDLDVRLASGSIEIDSVDTHETEVELVARNDAARELLELVQIELKERHDGHQLTVAEPERRGFGLFSRGPEWKLRVQCPQRTRADIRTRSADVSTHGLLAGLELKSASGDAEIDRVDGPIRIQSASGDVELDVAGGSLEVSTASGDLEVGRALGSVRAQLVSGDVHIREAHAHLESRTVSGDQRVEAIAAGPVSLQSVSGDLSVGVVPGRTLWMDVHSISGDTTSELEVSGDAPSGSADVLELRAKSVSGDIHITRAPAPLSTPQD